MKKEMKNFGLFLVASLISVFCLSSCLEGNSVSEGQAFGVLDIGDKTPRPVLSSTAGPFYSASLNSLDLGGCYYVYYSLDSDLPENAPAVVEANGYYTVSILDYLEVPKYYLRSYLTDTSEVRYGEMPVLDAMGVQAFVENNLFIIQTAKHPDDLELEWEMSYDDATMLPTIEGEKRYYDIFIRATKTNSSDGTASDKQHINAYYFGNYLKIAADKEKTSLGSGYNASYSKLPIRFNYVSEIKGDTALVWKNYIWEPYVANFVSD